MLVGCPENPTCNTCTLKKGKYTVPNYSELDNGYAITGAKLQHDVDFMSHCPRPPSGETPPCSRSDTKDVMPAEAGKTYTKGLIYETDSSQDTESAIVTITLSKSGKPDIPKTINVTVL